MDYLLRCRGHCASRHLYRFIAGAALAAASVMIPPQNGAPALSCGEPLAVPPCQTDSDSASKPVSRNNDGPSRATPYHSIIHSNIAAVADADTSQLLYEKDSNKVTPIASITKLMTAIVTLEAKLPLAEVIEVSDEDVDDLKGSHSLLSVGSRLTREDMLHIALMASENRAAACLSRNYPGGRPAFIEAMNRKARELGMDSTRFVSPNGLSEENVSTALDLVKLVKAACEDPLIRAFSTDTRFDVFVGIAGKRRLQYINTNRLVGRPDWRIELQKTGYISESGRCLVMEVQVDGRNLIMVFLDSYGKLTCFADARRVRRQLAAQHGR
jgi:D-alanyl-D-alanine endopeptidase (penicillin-binding protein 7)